MRLRRCGTKVYATRLMDNRSPSIITWGAKNKIMLSFWSNRINCHFRRRCCSPIQKLRLSTRNRGNGVRSRATDIAWFLVHHCSKMVGYARSPKLVWRWISFFEKGMVSNSKKVTKRLAVSVLVSDCRMPTRFQLCQILQNGRIVRRVISVRATNFFLGWCRWRHRPA